MTPFGFLNLDKPLGITSHDAVYAVRRAARRDGWPDLKVGHAGTLDPLATGVLIVCVGGAARLSDAVMTTTKRYTARVHLGVETTTYDAEGEIVRTVTADNITADQIAAVLPAFTGDLQQIPPLYSAIKQGGRKLYDIARSGGTAELTPRPVHIAALTVTAYEPPFLTLDVMCSAGTYIRSLAHDLGAALGVGGSLAALRRTASGAFTTDRAVPLTALDDPGWTAHLIDPRAALPGWPPIAVDAGQAAALRQGRAIANPAALPGPAFAVDDADRILAVLRGVGYHWQPDKVFA